MDKNIILEMKDYVLNKIVEFYGYYLNENSIESTFSNWNAKDVIAHINSWIKFSEDKLELIKGKRSFEDVSHVNIEEFNKISYDKNKNVKIENIINESRMILENYKIILDLFDERELTSEEFPTGFSFALWKYMAMDLCIHPIVHILHYYLKRKDYNKFIEGIDSSKKYFMDWSKNDIKVYFIGDLFEDRMEKENRFNELMETIKNKDDKLLEEIIKINID